MKQPEGKPPDKPIFLGQHGQFVDLGSDSRWLEPLGNTSCRVKRFMWLAASRATTVLLGDFARQGGDTATDLRRRLNRLRISPGIALIELGLDQPHRRAAVLDADPSLIEALRRGLEGTAEPTDSYDEMEKILSTLGTNPGSYTTLKQWAWLAGQLPPEMLNVRPSTWTKRGNSDDLGPWLCAIFGTQKRAHRRYPTCLPPSVARDGRKGCFNGSTLELVKRLAETVRKIAPATRRLTDSGIYDTFREWRRDV